MSLEDGKEYIITLRCPDQPGILAAVTPTLTENGCDIREAAIYGDADTGSFFVRMHVASSTCDAAALKTVLQPIAAKMDLEIAIHNASHKMKILIAVSKFDHCLQDLLYKWKIGALPVEITGIVSNHDLLRPLAEQHNLPFHHLPISKETKAQQEAQFAQIIEQTSSDLVVLARYMQILSDEFSRKLDGQCINIHHSFLPSFKGAKPYHQAHARGVKLIGATAHFVTSDLDEGPIIEQEVRRVTHATSAEEMVAIGREVEASVLSRAVRWHAERRVFLNGSRTVVLAK